MKNSMKDCMKDCMDYGFAFIVLIGMLFYFLMLWLISISNLSKPDMVQRQIIMVDPHNRQEKLLQEACTQDIKMMRGGENLVCVPFGPVKGTWRMLIIPKEREFDCLTRGRGDVCYKEER